MIFLPFRPGVRQISGDAPGSAFATFHIGDRLLRLVNDYIAV
jgi:hypothetical protein